MSDPNGEEVSEVSEEFKHLLQNLHFRFEGLSTEIEEDFVKVVKKMGAEVSNQAPITFVQKSYFEKQKIGGRKDFYNINYIADSVEAGTALDLKNYIFVPDVDLDDEPLCYAARYMYRTDSCEECYHSKVFCKECTKESRLEESLRAANQDRNDIISETDTRLKHKIMNTIDQKALRHSSKSSKRRISSDSEKNPVDEEQRKSNCAERSPVKKRLKISSDVDDTSNREESPVIYVVNGSDSDCSQSNDKPVNNSQNGQVKQATNGISDPAHNVIQQRTLRPRTNGVAETADNISLSDDPNDKSKMPVKTKPPRLVPEPEPLPKGSLNFVDVEERYFTGKEWWKPRDIPENERCTVLNCSYEPEPHPMHYQFRKFLSEVEKKILVKYLIIKNAIDKAKGQSIYQKMIEDGYLTHRSFETLRSSYRRTIIYEIHKYKLEVGTLNKFLALELPVKTKAKKN